MDWVLYRSHSKAKLRRIGADAGRWLFRDVDSDEEGTFSSVCGNLDLNAELVRSKIRGLTEEAARKLRGMEFGDDG